MPFSTDRGEWLNTPATHTRTGKRYSLYPGVDPAGGTQNLEVRCYGNVVAAYREHPESKFVDHEGNTCTNITQGLLHRTHIVANNHRYIGKETSRRWEQGDDLSMLNFKSVEYHDGKVIAHTSTIDELENFSEREIHDATGLDRKTIRLIRHRKEGVKPLTLRKIENFIEQIKVSTDPTAGHRGHE